MTAATRETLHAIARRRRGPVWRRWPFWAFVVLALAAAGSWVWQRGQADSSPPVGFTTADVGRGAITVIVSAVGTVEPILQVDVGSLISGTILEVAVAVNERVSKGQTLARLDTSALTAELARDYAALMASKAAVEDAMASREAALDGQARTQKMYDKGLVTEEVLAAATTAKRRADAALASAEANVHVAEANVKLSQTSIDKAEIMAPIDGMVLARTAELGQTVSAGGASVSLFTLAHDLGQMQLQVDVGEADIGRVEVGDRATFSVDAWLGQNFPAEVKAMYFAPQKVDGIVTYATILGIDNSDLRLRPGMTASADIVVEEVGDALTVPNAAFRFAPPMAQEARPASGLLGMLFSGGGPGSNRQRTTLTNEVTAEGLRNLYVLRDGAAVKVAVKTGVTDGEMTEVLAGGLAAGDQVITAQSAAQ